MDDETLPEVTPSDAAQEPVVVADATPPAVTPAVPSEHDKVQKRIDELVWKNAELRRQMDALQKPAAPPQPAKPIVAPTLEQFEYDEDKFRKAQQDYIDSLVDQKIADRLSKVEQERQVKAREQTFQQRQQEFASKNPEYVEKVIQGAERGEWACSEAMAEMIQESDKGPEVALYLASNPDVAKQIAGLSDRAAARELGRIEAKLEKPVVAPVTRISQAPPPAPKLEASDGAVTPKTTDPDSDKLSNEEWNRLEKKRMAKR